MRILVWLFLAGMAVILLFQANPASLAWLRACNQEPAYTPLALTDGFTLLGLAVMAVCCAALFATLRAVLRATPPDAEQVSDFFAAENGALIFEFALVFPFILSLVFILFQWAELLMVDRLTHYAAFCAARSASSWAADAATGPRYVITKNDPKFEKMRASAQMALYPAMALEGTSQGALQVKLLDLDRGNEVPATDTKVVEKKRYEHVGVEVIWGLRPRWPVVGLFFKPMLEEGRIPISRSYRMEIEPYVMSDTRFPFDMVFREEKARQALHKKAFPGNHHTSLTFYSAGTVTKRKRGDMTECTWVGLSGTEPCCPANKWGQLGQLPNPFGAATQVPPE